VLYHWGGTGAEYMLWSRCRVRVISNTGTTAAWGVSLVGSDSADRVENCIITCEGTAPTVTIGIRRGDTNTPMYAYNNTIVGPFNIGIQNADVSAARLVAKNNIVDGATTPFSQLGGGWGASDYNATTGTGAPGANSRDSQTFTYVGAPDYTLSPSDAGARNFGTTIGGFSIDMAGVSRPIGATWDIGASEAAAAAGGRPPYEGLVRGLARGLRSS